MHEFHILQFTHNQHGLVAYQFSWKYKTLLRCLNGIPVCVLPKRNTVLVNFNSAKYHVSLTICVFGNLFSSMRTVAYHHLNRFIFGSMLYKYIHKYMYKFGEGIGGRGRGGGEMCVCVHKFISCNVRSFSFHFATSSCLDKKRKYI